jgi:hypothetical protein
VIAAVPIVPSLAALIVTVPAAIAVTNPFTTLAFVASLVDHVTVRPVSAVPLASRGVAVNCVVAPIASSAADGVTATDATATYDGPEVDPLESPLPPQPRPAAVTMTIAIRATRALTGRERCASCMWILVPM